jgi:hypothetical protein
MPKGKASEAKKSEVLQGTLDLMILKSLQVLGPLHGFGIARRLRQLSEEVLQLNAGTALPFSARSGSGFVRTRDSGPC